MTYGYLLHDTLIAVIESIDCENEASVIVSIFSIFQHSNIPETFRE